MWETLWGVVTPFDAWWAYPLTWAAVTWVIATGILRFWYRQCPWEYKDDEVYWDGKGIRRVRGTTLRFSRTDCKNKHPHHVWVRDNPWVAALWPLFLPFALIGGVLFAYFGSMKYVSELGVPETKEVKS